MWALYYLHKWFASCIRETYTHYHCDLSFPLAILWLVAQWIPSGVSALLSYPSIHTDGLITMCTGWALFWEALLLACFTVSFSPPNLSFPLLTQTWYLELYSNIMYTCSLYKCLFCRIQCPHSIFIGLLQSMCPYVSELATFPCGHIPLLLTVSTLSVVFSYRAYSCLSIG